MPSFFSDQPLILQFLPGLNHGVVISINRIGQVLIVSAALMHINQERLFALIPRWAQNAAFFIRYVAAQAGWNWSERSKGYEFPPRRRLDDKDFHEDVSIGWHFVFSTLFLGTVLWFWGRGPLGWLCFPFEFAFAGFAEAQWSLGAIARTVARIILGLLAFFPLLYFAILACAIVARPYAFLFTKVAEKFSPGYYRLAVSVVLVVGSLLVIIAT